MKKILGILTALCLMAGISHAGCGKKVTDTGVLKAYDAETKQITIVGAKSKLTITPKTKGARNLKALVGKKVKVISEHKKVDSVEAVKG